MEKAKKPFYKYCFVPRCKNTIRSTPDKIFFCVPRDQKTRKRWCKIIRRDEVSPISCLYCCEDHFNIEEDTLNYVQYNIMKQQGEKVTLRLKEGVVPHIIQRQKRNVPPLQVRMSTIETKRLALVNEALAEFAVNSSNALEICKSLQTSDYEAGHSIHIDKCDDYQARPSMDDYKIVKQPCSSHIEVCDNIDKLHCDKAVQVNVKAKYKSKGVNAKTMKKKNVALSHFSLSSKHIATSQKKSAVASVLSRKLFSDNPVDSVSTSSNSSALSHDYEPCSSSELCCVQDDSEDKKLLKNFMRSGILAAIDKEPEMLLGLP